MQWWCNWNPVRRSFGTFTYTNKKRISFSGKSTVERKEKEKNQYRGWWWMGHYVMKTWWCEGKIIKLLASVLLTRSYIFQVITLQMMQPTSCMMQYSAPQYGNWPIVWHLDVWAAWTCLHLSLKLFYFHRKLRGKLKQCRSQLTACNLVHPILNVSCIINKNVKICANTHFIIIISDSHTVSMVSFLLSCPPSKF
jgi:hypothetical protein